VAADVDDLVQETFLVLLGVPFEERSHAATAAFLRRIARNLFLKRVRVGRREVVDLDAIEAAWVAFDSGDGGDAYLVALRHCLAGLGASSRLALELRYRDALSPGAIADRLGLSLGGARSVLLRAKARLRACISQRIEP
jgi:RNA polymerase sigma-70 factor (ECF subfamily)